MGGSSPAPFVVAAILAYNEENTIGRVVLQAQKFVDKVVVCDDGSGDLTGEITEGLGAVVVRHGKNLGKGAAFKSLFGKASELEADVVVTLDGDGQHDPIEIPLVTPVRARFQVSKISRTLFHLNPKNIVEQTNE